MKKFLSLILCLVCISSGCAQPLVTTVVKHFLVGEIPPMESHVFNVGDTVSVLGYKKKGDVYHFALESPDYAALIFLTYNPFALEEKRLKKLPDALGKDMKKLIAERQAAVISRRCEAYKLYALQGNVHAVVSSLEASTHGKLYDDAHHHYFTGSDSVCILGYSKNSLYTFYALYNDKVAGVFRSFSRNPFVSPINTTYMPSTEDADVQAELKRRQEILDQQEEVRKQRLAEERRRRREDALQGKILMVMNDGYHGYNTCFASGDTVAVLGFKKDIRRHYALSSPKGASIYECPEYRNPFTAELDTEGLPSSDDPDVLRELERRKAIVDSCLAVQRIIEDSLNRVKQREEYMSTINFLKESSPVIIMCKEWDMDAVGGITAYFHVYNASLNTIKYITFKGYFTNPVGDRCRNEIGGSTTWQLRGVGPIGPRPTSLDDFMEKFPESVSKYTFDCFFYSTIADRIHVSSVTIQYMNGKTITLSGKALDAHLTYE